MLPLDAVFKQLAKIERQRKLVRDSLAEPTVKARLVQQLNDFEAEFLRQNAPLEPAEGGSGGAGGGAPGAASEGRKKS